MHAHTINTRPYFLPAVILAKNRPGDEASACGFLEIRVIIAPKWGVPNGNHTNDDVAEVNGLAAPMLPGSFLHKKEPGYEASDPLSTTELLFATAYRTPFLKLERQE